MDKVTAEHLLKELETASDSVKDQPFASRFDLYHKEFLLKSVKRGLVNNTDLSISGDRTPVVTSARERKHRVCDCLSKDITDCNCDRFFSQPDCDTGCDSSRECFYSGYSLYTFVAFDSESDLPVFALPQPASRHNSLAFCYAYFDMAGLLPEFHVKKFFLTLPMMPCRSTNSAEERESLRLLTSMKNVTSKPGIKLTLPLAKTASLSAAPEEK